jgi:hypothetical protein
VRLPSASLALAAALLAGCGSGSHGAPARAAAPPAAAPAPTPAPAFPRYNEVYGIATHNSYWINRGHLADPYASGTEELISDQLLHEHVRALEIDVHTDRQPGVWSVYHTDRPDYSQVHTLAEALEVLRDFHRALPDHEVVNIVIELKNTAIDWLDFPASEKNFDATHTIDDFDRLIRTTLGPALYEPRDFLARGAPGATLADVAASAGWPRIDELRGRFIVNLIGSWSSAAFDWARYAGEAPIAQRACFPLRSIFDAQGGGTVGTWPGSVFDPIPPGWLAAAHDASIFWQVEDLSCPLVPPFLARGGVVRGGLALEPAEQVDQIRRGYQMIMTDYPWSFVENGGPPGSGIAVDPSRRLRDPAFATGRAPLDPAALVEPGGRIYASSDAPPRFLYAWQPAAAPRAWETTVSTTRIGDPYGCRKPRAAREGGVGGLRAAASRGELFEVLRVKTGASGDTLDQERLAVRVGIAHGGIYRAVDFPASPYGLDISGNMVALEVVPAGSGAIARAYSAGRLDASGEPLWTLLLEEPFAVPLAAQGLVFTGDVLFVGTRVRAGRRTAPGAQNVAVCDLPGLEGGDATVVDLSSPAAPAACRPQPAPLP